MPEQVSQVTVQPIQTVQPSIPQPPPINQASAENTSGQGKNAIIPEGIKGWSPSAFLWGFIWAISNRVWIGLLTLIPFVGIIMNIILGLKGREWAWQAKHWESIEQFNKVQRRWVFWGFLIIGIVIVLLIIMILFAVYKLKNPAVLLETG